MMTREAIKQIRKLADNPGIQQLLDQAGVRINWRAVNAADQDLFELEEEIRREYEVIYTVPVGAGSFVLVPEYCKVRYYKV
jgi:hypothetical protein